MSFHRAGVRSNWFWFWFWRETFLYIHQTCTPATHTGHEFWFGIDLDYKLIIISVPSECFSDVCKRFAALYRTSSRTREHPAADMLIVLTFWKPSTSRYLHRRDRCKARMQSTTSLFKYISLNTTADRLI